MSEVLKAALEEIDEYCDYNKWLNEINIFCKKWTDRSVKELKGEAAFTIEVRHSQKFVKACIGLDEQKKLSVKL